MRAATAILLMAIATAACGGGGPTGSAPFGTSAPIDTSAPAVTSPATATQPPAGAALDPCALVTDEDIRQATGRDVDTKTPGSVMGIFSNGCSWVLAVGDNEIVPVDIQLGVISPGGLRYYETYLKPYDSTPISGIGDDAVTHSVGGVDAVKGDTLLSMFVIAMGTDEEEDITRDLLTAAFSRVP